MDKTMANNLIYFPNDDTQNNHFCRLLLMAETLGNTLNLLNQSIKIHPFEKSSKLLSQRIRKHYKTLGTSVLHSLMSPPFPVKIPKLVNVDLESPVAALLFLTFTLSFLQIYIKK